MREVADKVNDLEPPRDDLDTLCDLDDPTQRLRCLDVDYGPLLPVLASTEASSRD